MADKTEAAELKSPPSPDVPGAGAVDEWDSPAAHGIVHEVPIEGNGSPAEPDAPSPDDEVTPAAAALSAEDIKKIIRDEMVATRESKAEPALPKREPLKLDLSDEFDPALTKQLQGLVAQLNERDQARETEYREALSKVGALEADNQLNKEERALSKMLDALPNEHFRAVFEGEGANDNYQAAAKKVSQLRRAYKAEGGKVPTDRALFSEAAKSLFFEKADEIRQKGGRPKKDRTMNRVNPPTNGQPKQGKDAAYAAWNQMVRERGLNLPLAVNSDPEERGF